jgi:hypothetical protein
LAFPTIAGNAFLFNKEIKQMKQQFRHTMFPQWLLIVIIALLCFGVAIPSAAQADMAQLRVAHYVFGAPSVNLYVDGKVIVGAADNLPSVFSPMTLQGQYIDLTAGVHTFAAVPDGDTLKSAVINDQEFTLETGRHYMLAVMGHLAASDLHFTLLDETAAIEQNDITKSAVTFLINNVYGIPAIDISFADKPIVNNLAYGDAFIMQDPTEGKGSKITAHGDPNSVIFAYADAVGSPANILAVFVFSGTFPGTMDKDYTVYYDELYVGKLTITDSGTIAVGDSLPVEFTGIGQRVQYKLTLTKTTTLDILQTANDVTSGGDANLRLYNAAGDMLFLNDELTMDDNAQGIFDAGWKGLTLDAGTYTLEAGTFVDAGTGAFTLSVNASP